MDNWSVNVVAACGMLPNNHVLEPPRHGWNASDSEYVDVYPDELPY